MNSRRSFLRTTAATAAGLAFPTLIPARVFAASPNGKVRHAAIGCSNQAWSDLQVLAGSGKIEVVALCDVDVAAAAEARAAFPQAKFVQDWRELLGDMADQFDSVNVTVPDHMHAAMTLQAMRQGKHVYCQKPLTRTIAEARAVAEASTSRPQLVTQMGNQIQSEYEYRSAVELLKTGVIGKVKEIHAWTSATFPQRGRPAGADPVPEGLNWDHWLGVAPVRPYKKDIYHRFNWRGWQDFGGGPIADFCCHILDTPFKALDLVPPTSVQAEVPKEWADSEEMRKENWPDWAIYRYEFAATPMTSGPLPVTWYDGGRQPDPALFQGATIPGGGALFIGEDGTLLLPHYATPRVLGRKIELPKLEPRNHYHHFIESILSEGKVKTTSPFSFGAPLTETGLLGTIASRFPGKKLDWHSGDMRFTNNEAANALVRPSYRDGWAVKELS
jgi:predicted dehydrogenase